jgi:hypothetical protein
MRWLVAAAAAGGVAGQPWPWYNTTLPLAARVAALMSALTPAEKIGLMSNDNQGVARLNVPAYE